MRFVNSIFSAAAFVLLVSSCNSVDFKKTKSGIPYKIIPGNGKETAPVGGFLKVHMTYKRNDSLLNSTYSSAPSYLPVLQEPQKYDVTEITPLLKKGDSVYMVQMVDTLMKQAQGQQFPPFLRKGDKIITTIKVLEVFKSEAEARADYSKESQSAYRKSFMNDPKIQAQLKKDDQLIQDHLAKNNIKAQKVGLGTYVEMLAPGTGPKVEDGKHISLKYKGTTFAGKVFDTNMDESFKHSDPLNMQIGSGGSIPGFEEGLKALNEGARARLYIPSVLAYGEQSPSPDIKANENLIFEIQVLDVADQAPAPTPNMAPSPNNDTTRR